jgi:hypothetical protein
VRDAYLLGAALRLRTKRGAIAAFGASQAGQEHDLMLSSMTLSGMGPSLAVEGATTASVFEAYVEQVLAPSLEPEQR